MLTQEQIKARKIGGSDVSTILGLNPFQTPEELRLTILGRIPRFEGNDATLAGDIMEEGIRQLYAARTGRKVRRSNVTLVHPKYEWLTAHVDGLIEGEKRGLECKNVHWRLGGKWGPEGTDEIAEYYFCQPHTYMMVKNYPVWDVAAYFGGADLRIYTIERDPEVDAMIVEATHDFWFINVLQDVPCEISNEHPHALSAIKNIYPGTDGSIVDISSLEHWHRVRMDAKEAIKRYSAVADGADFQILQAMGNAAVGTLADGSRYTRKLVKRKGYAVDPSEYIDFRFSKGKESTQID